MKALNTHQYILADYDTKEDLIEYLGIEIPDYGDDVTLEQTKENIYKWNIEFTKFEDKPFNPEQIPGLFEGWEYVNIAQSYHKQAGIGELWGYKYNNRFIQFSSNMYVNSDRVGVYHPPKTLNDFITNCQQAGIELVFKKGCAK